MPTRIVLHSTTPLSATTARETSHVNRPPIGLPGVSLQKSIREQGGHQGGNRQRQGSSNDIRGSQRLTAYVCALLASAIQLASVIQFFENQDATAVPFRLLQEASSERGEDSDGEGDRFIETFGSKVLWWKLYAALGYSIAAVSIYVLIILAHIDGFLLPSLWKRIFRDGSRLERNLIVALTAFWAGSLHICTSTFSVGSVQPNVYFTTWIGFAAAVVNLDVWRAGAGKPTGSALVRRSHRETTKNWIWVLAFETVASFSTLELFINRQELVFHHNGQEVQPPISGWIRALSISFGVLLTGTIMLVGNQVMTWSYEVKIPCSAGGMTFSWRSVEGLVIIGVLITYGWTVLEYTGVTGALNGPGNAYFGLWGSFFSAVSLLGTWLKEAQANGESSNASADHEADEDMGISHDLSSDFMR